MIEFMAWFFFITMVLPVLLVVAFWIVVVLFTGIVGVVSLPFLAVGYVFKQFDIVCRFLLASVGL